MFYVVRLAGINQRDKHHVFPILWMKNGNVQLEKFVQNRINRNQIHVFFWSNETDDDGKPNTNVQPNFDLPIENVFPPTVDGCFLGQPVNFFCNYADAVTYKDRLRSMEPGLYNVRRLLETPLPDLNQNIVHEEDDSTENFSELAVSSSSDGVSDHEINESLPYNDDNSGAVASNTDLNETEENINGADSATEHELNVSMPKNKKNVGDVASSIDLNETEKNIGETDSATERELDNTIQANDAGIVSSNPDLAETEKNVSNFDSGTNRELNESILTNTESRGNADSTNENVLVKVEMRVVRRTELAHINAISNESDDDIEMTVLGNGSFPMPVQYSHHQLLKRENDPISGNLACSEAPQVCILDCV